MCILKFKLICDNTVSWARDHVIWNLFDTPEARYMNLTRGDNKCEVLCMSK